MKLLPFRRPPTLQPYSLIDVGQATVKVAIVMAAPSEVHLISTATAPTHGHDIAGGRVEAEAILEAVNTALTAAEDKSETVLGYKVVPDEVVFALPNRAAVGQLFIIDQKRPKPHDPISGRELAQLTATAQRSAEKNWQASLAEEGRWQTVSMTEMGWQVDGQPILKRVGLRGRQVTISFFGVAAEPPVLRGVEFLAEALNLTLRQTMFTGQALSYGVKHPNALILDIGESGTGIYLIRDTMLTMASELPLGGRFFTQTLSQGADLKTETAQALQQAWAKGELAAHEAAWLTDRLREPSYRWHQALLELLHELAEDTLLPRFIYLTGGASQLPILPSVLRTQLTLFDGAPEYCSLGERPSTGFKNLAGSLNYAQLGVIVGLTLGMKN